MFVLSQFPKLSPEENPGAGGGAAPEVKPEEVKPEETPKPPDGAGDAQTVSKSVYDALVADHGKLQSFAERMKTDEKSERDKRQKAQTEQGEFKALSESLAEDKAALLKENEEHQLLIKTLTPKATSYEGIEASLTAQVVERLKDESLPSSVKIALAAMTDPLQQVQYLDAFDAEHKKPGGTPATKPATSGGAPTNGQNGDTVDFMAEVAAGRDLQDVIAENQDAWNNQLQGAATHQSQGGFMRALSGGWQKAQ